MFLKSLCKAPEAPPSTPMSGLEMPASVDLSAALDPSKAMRAGRIRYLTLVKCHV